MSSGPDHDGDRIILVSADGHAGPKAEVYRDYIDPVYRDMIDELVVEEQEFLESTGPISAFSEAVLDVIDDRSAIREGGQDGGWDLDVRLREMDREGVTADILIPGSGWSMLPFFQAGNAPRPPELRAAGVRAYNRWFADFAEAADGRIYGVADSGPCVDIDETVRELQWNAEHHFVGVCPPGSVSDPSLLPLSDPYYDPFWAACCDLGLVLTAHAGWGRTQGEFQVIMKAMAQMGALDMDKIEAMVEAMNTSDSPIALDMGPRRLIWKLMLGGVFDRFPDLKLVLTEVRADWLPVTFAQFEQRLAESGTTLALSPREYYERHIRFTPSSIHRAEIEMRGEIGIDQMLFGMDYPHPEGMWPNLWDWLRVALVGVGETEIRKFLGGNAIETYSLDRGTLAAVADRIGPRVSDLQGPYEVDEARINHFHRRGGYAKPPEKVDMNVLDSAISEDLAAAAGARS